jgi:uncharacterized protein
MIRIGLLSDTHAHLDRRIPDFFASCDEIWHAGDIGSLEVVEQLQALKPLRAVFGNIDGRLIRNLFPEDLRFTCEGLEVFMTHIGGYPGKYTPRVRTILQQNPPGLYICGHSHILKVMPDKSLGLLHINPGACGNEGFHRVKTIVRFSISEGKPHDLEVIELR